MTEILDVVFLSHSPLSPSQMEKYRALCIKRVYLTTPPLNHSVITRLILLQKEAFEVPSKMRTRHQTLTWTSCFNYTNRILMFSGQKQWLWKLVGLCAFKNMAFPNPGCVDGYFQHSAYMEIGPSCLSRGMTYAQQHRRVHFL